jgi:hypothetical protein
VYINVFWQHAKGLSYTAQGHRVQGLLAGTWGARVQTEIATQGLSRTTPSRMCDLFCIVQEVKK